MLVLVLNSGSSSLKYQLRDVDSGRSLAGGLVERIGESGSRLTHRTGVGRPAGTEETLVVTADVADHREAIRLVDDAFEQTGPVRSAGVLGVVGHRVVHGGDRFSQPTLVTPAVLATIESLVPLAPLHNPANIQGIVAAQDSYPDVPHVAVFDTAFHQTMPPHAYTYAIDRDVAAAHGIRRYGFHGTSHQYVARTAAAFLGRPAEAANLVTLHLGNGASACAVAGGRSVDTSMGLTPLEGLVMGTRSGDIDPAIVFHLVRTGGLHVDEVDALLNRRSGLLGLAGVNDMREVHALAAAGDTAARLALDVYCHRIRSYVGSYLATLGRCDAVVFTGGVGENDPVVRARSLDGMAELGITVDAAANEAARGPAEAVDVAAADSRIRVLVVPTDEELEIARQAAAVAAAPST